MYWLAEICVKRPVFALMLVMALVVAGLVAFPSLGIDRFPSTDLPTVIVRTNYPGAASQEVESEVSQLVEDAVSTVAGIEELRSVSNDGSSLVLITFSLTRDIDAAVQDVRDAVSAVSNRLPRTIDPPVVQKSDLDSSPIMSIAVSGEKSASELYLLADRYVKGVIESSPGVGLVSISGVAERAIKIDIDAKRLAAYQLSIAQVRDAVARQNTEVPGGRVDEGLRERSLRTLGRVSDAKDFPELVIETIGGSSIRLADLGEVKDATKEVRTIARLDGKPTVILSVQRQSGENTVKVIEGVKKRLERSREMLPAEVRVAVIQDQSRYILSALHEIENHLISGSVLACLTVLLFMRSWRSTLIASVAIPASIIATFAFIKAFGFTLNNVTMLALVLMVGVVIDDAIVVLENIFRCIEEEGMDPYQASIDGTKEIGLAVLATTASLVIVFLPVSFLSSVTGRMLFEFGVTATVAILVSMVISFTLTPMMCSLLLKAHPKEAQDQPTKSTRERGFYHWVEASYMLSLRWALKYRFFTVLLCIATILANIPLYGLVKQDYIPTNVDESEFEISLNTKEGTSIRSMNEAMQRVEERVREVEGVELTLASVGTRGFGGVNSGNVFVRLTESHLRTFSFSRLLNATFAGSPSLAFEGNFTQQQKMLEIRKALKEIPDVRASIRNLTSLRQGPNVDIDFSITGPDTAELAAFSERMRQGAAKLPGIVDVDTTLRLDKPELLVSIDRERAAIMGVSVQEIADTLRIAVGGDDRVSRYRDAKIDDAYDVELRLVGVDRQSVDSISQLYVRAQPSRDRMSADGSGGVMATANGTSLTRIDNVVRFEFGDSQARIDRLDRQRMVAIRANIAPGYALSDRVKAMRDLAAEIGLPPGFSAQVLGRGKELERTLSEFRWTFLLSFIFMYIVLAAQFEHLVHPLTILFTLPLSIPFGLISLYWGNETLNVYSALGVLVLFGVVKKAAILQVDCTNALRRKGMEREQAILQANRDRLRPILMTTISFVAGLLPLLIANGPGAEERRSIAVLTTGGQTLSLLLTLLAVPVIYTYLDDFGALFVRKTKSSGSENNEPKVLAVLAPTSNVANIETERPAVIQA